MARRLVGWSDSFLGTLSDRPLHRFSKGGSGSGGSGGSSGGGGEAQPSSGSSPELPDGVRRFSAGDLRQYSFDVAGKRVNLSMSPPLGDGRVGNTEVLFTVDGGFNRGELKGRDATRAALILKSTIEYDAARRPNGFIYVTSAWTGDDAGEKRARSYSRIGFSTPSRAGNEQWAIVQNGKLEPYTPPRRRRR